MTSDQRPTGVLSIPDAVRYLLGHLFQAHRRDRTCENVSCDVLLPDAQYGACCSAACEGEVWSSHQW